MELITHINVDLDAVGSLWAYIKFALKISYRKARIRFVSANWDGKGKRRKDIALDIEAGVKGFKGIKKESGEVLSCFSLLIGNYCTNEEKYALKELVRYIDEQDATGNGAKAFGLNSETAKVWQRTGLIGILNGFKHIHKGNDLKVCQEMFKILDAILGDGLARSGAWKQLEQVKWRGKVAIADNLPQDMTKILFKKGAQIVIFLRGNNIGVLKKKDLDVPLNHGEIIAVLGEEAKEWFYHSSGFLFCRGSDKSPVETPSRVRPEELAEAYDKILNNSGVA
jgi:hypothetical protein